MTPAVRFLRWFALIAAGSLLLATVPVGQTLWAKILIVSGEVDRASPPPTPTATATPAPGEGCTPGFWKQAHHFAFWPDPYGPDDLLAEVLAVEPFEGDPTLLDALETGGGGGEALLRHAVAAILNAAHDAVDYRYTVDEVLEMVRAALATGDVEATKNMLEAANEASCPLPVDADLEASAPVVDPASAAPEATATPDPSPTAEATEDVPTETATATAAPE